MCIPFVPDVTPTAARALGLEDRFRYCRGGSGRRYLFTAVAQDSVDDIGDAVVIMTVVGPGGDQQVAWVGEVDAAGARRGRAVGAAGGTMRTFVHYLARSAEDRRRIVDDLIAAA